MSKKYSIEDLQYLMSRLRDPETGCPWDIKQSFASIVPSTIEEAYEVADTIERRDFAHLQEELGDLLFQVIFYSQIGKEEGLFVWDDVVHGLTKKLVRRHPHVFPEGTLDSKVTNNDANTEAQIKASWEEIKKEERLQKGSAGVLDDVPVNLPSLSRAAKLQKRAAKVGFDWADAKQILAKIKEEVAELESEMQAAESSQEVMDELGDVIFSCVNLARYLNKDPEAIVRASNRKFEGRFRYIERSLSAAKKDISETPIEEMESLWQEAKSEGL
ncbi:nucleoside triphosphate pyrophosphohydrolase [Saccharophagus degradans]|uniref:nucleoside triphosphate pyrophosphohydrolase n=1 Tax=Saccharophagus degradans TaxID=86304 RepID=UPI001C091BDC|nr:nucleoside triphosphate pyrophosphohydrolase [Saccharophagus degradans]MBU2985911.1 nucleoside triphosphate pyrophosphohydrolase [Saccharophagus degradans]